MSNCPNSVVSVGLRLSRGLGDWLLLLPGSSVSTQAFGHRCEGCSPGAWPETELLPLSSLIDQHGRLVCMTVQKKLLCSVLSQGITIECVKITLSA